MILVGISGCTNGGKSTLAKLLLGHYPNSAYICQDTFFFTRDSGKLEYVPSVKSHNFDTLTAIDTERFIRSLEELINHDKPKYSHIFVDGFLIFMMKDAEFVKQLEAKFFFTLSKEECWRRRSQRTYKTVGSLEYFEELVWPCYQNYLKFCQENYTDITYFDGDQADSVTAAFEAAKARIDALEAS